MMKPLWLLTLYCVSVALTSCVTNYSAPGFAEHEARVLVSTSPSAIVGMWFLESDPAVNSGAIRSTFAYCFKSDGTGYYRVATDGYTPSMAMAFTGDRQVHNITWKYDGNGWWTSYLPLVSMKRGPADLPMRFRTDGKVLLMYSQCGGVMSRMVLTRKANGE